MRTFSWAFADLRNAIDRSFRRFGCRVGISALARRGTTKFALGHWIVIHFLVLSTTGAACGMSNLESDSLPDDLISYVQENRINLDMYVIERAVKGGKLVIYLLDKDLPKGYRGSRPGVRQYEFIFDPATKKMLGVSLMR